jgi:hypothetical protein
VLKFRVTVPADGLEMFSEFTATCGKVSTAAGHAVPQALTAVKEPSGNKVTVKLGKVAVAEPLAFGVPTPAGKAAVSG